MEMPKIMQTSVVQKQNCTQSHGDISFSRPSVADLVDHTMLFIVEKRIITLTSYHVILVALK